MYIKLYNIQFKQQHNQNIHSKESQLYNDHPQAEYSIIVKFANTSVKFILRRVHTCSNT